MLDIERITAAVIALCQRLHVKRLDLFGSAVTEELSPEGYPRPLAAAGPKANSCQLIRRSSKEEKIWNT